MPFQHPVRAFGSRALPQPIINSQSTLRRLRLIGIAIVGIVVCQMILIREPELRQPFLAPLLILVLIHLTAALIEYRMAKPIGSGPRVIVYQITIFCLVGIAFLEELSSASILLLIPFVVLAGIYLPHRQARVVVVEIAVLLSVVSFRLGVAPVSFLVVGVVALLGWIAAEVWNDEERLLGEQSNERGLLDQLIRDMTLAFDRDSVVEQIIEFIRKVVPESSGLIFGRDHEDRPFTVMSSWGYDQRPDFEFWPVGYSDQGYTGTVLATRLPLHISDTRRRKDITPKYDQIAGLGPLRSYLGIPLLVENELIGALVMTGTKPDMFSREQIEYFSRICEWLAVNLYNARKVGLFRGIEEILQSSPEAAILVNKQGGVEAANDEARQLLGYPGEEIYEMSVVEFWGSLESARKIRQQMEQSPRGIQGLPKAIRNRSGQEVQVLFSGQMLYEPASGSRRGSIGYFKTIEDYTAQAQKLDRFTAVDQAVLDAIRASDHRELAQRFLLASSKILGTDSMHIRMLDESLSYLDLTYGIGPYPEVAVQRKRLGHYVSGRVVEDDRPLVVNDTRLDAYTQDMLIRHQEEPILSFLNRFMSYMVVPMRVGNEAIGTLHAEAEPIDFFQDERRQIMTLMANRIAPVLQSVLLNERLAARVDLLRRQAAATEVLLALDEQGAPFHRRVVELGAQLLDTEDCTLFLADPHSDLLRVAASTAIPESLWEHYTAPISADPGSGLHALVAQTGHTISTTDKSEKDLPGWNQHHALHTSALESGASRAQLLVSLPSLQAPRAAARGVLKVENLRGQDALQAFSTYQQEALRLFAIQVAGMLAAQDPG